MISAYNSATKEYIVIDAGLLIVKTFERLYADYKDRYALTRDYYAMPRIDREPRQSPIQYRGLDRDALDDYADSGLDAEVLLALLALERGAVNGIVFSPGDAQQVFEMLGPLQIDYEILWTRIAGSNVEPPGGYCSAGYDPTYFSGDHFSASCDCMLIPRWHGTDEAGELFLPFFHQLNAYGLFENPEVAQEFLDYYLSFDWTERGDFVIAEVFLRQ